eukprot:583970-Rhodomonas_salina.2
MTLYHSAAELESHDGAEVGSRDEPRRERVGAEVGLRDVLRKERAEVGPRERRLGQLEVLREGAEVGSRVERGSRGGVEDREREQRWGRGL